MSENEKKLTARVDKLESEVREIKDILLNIRFNSSLFLNIMKIEQDIVDIKRRLL